MQHLLRPLAVLCLRRAQPENRPALAPVERIASRSLAAAKQRRSVQIARLVEYQIAGHHVAILAALETVEHLLRRGIAWLPSSATAMK